MCLRDHTSKSLNVKQMVILALQVVINNSDQRVFKIVVFFQDFRVLCTTSS